LKKLIVAVMAATVVTLALAPAAVAGPATRALHPKPFSVTGKVTAADAAAGTVSIKVWDGSVGIKRYHGKTMTLTINRDAKILDLADGSYTAIALVKVKVGAHVAAWGRIDRSKPNTVAYRVRRFVVHSTWAFAARGPVTAVDAPSGTLTMTINASFGIKPFVGTQAKLSLAGGGVVVKIENGVVTQLALASVKAGDRVFAIGMVDNSDPASMELRAAEIIIRT
jgi:Cu/Ag efflux protein CusF